MKYLCIDIGGTAIKHAVLDEEGRFLEKGESPTQSGLGAERVVENVFAVIDSYIGRYRLSGVGISTTGMVDCERGEVFFAGETMPGYSHTPWKCMIEEKYGMRCEVENDVNCAALAEFRSGEGRGAKKLLCLTVGTGIGGAFIMDGRIYHGASYSALEAGYMLLGQENFQSLASVMALCRYVAEKKGDEAKRWNGFEILEAMKAGDEDCREAVEYICRNLSRGLANLIYILNPDRVVLGGGIMEQGELLRPMLNQHLSEILTRGLMDDLDLRFAARGNSAGIMGAFYMFQEKSLGDYDPGRTAVSAGGNTED